MFHSLPRQILVLAPHTDDGELGAGGLLSRAAEEGCPIHYVAFSDCSDSVSFSDGINPLHEELKTALHTISPNISYDINSFPVRRFDAYRQEILDILISLSKTYQPDLVLCPSSYDTHQDHTVIHSEAVRAFKATSILGYELPWNNLSFAPNCYIRLSYRHAQAKIDALSKYRSQSSRPYMKSQYILSHLTFRGLDIKQEYAECFQNIRTIY